MVKSFLLKYGLYIFRWQLSTPILAIVISLFPVKNEWLSATIANFIGALIFFWIDKIIFKPKYNYDLWSIKENIKCVDCGNICRGYRLVLSDKYNKINDPQPEFRCEACSQHKRNSFGQRKHYRRFL